MVATSWMFIPLSNRFVASVLRYRCGWTFSTPAAFPILFMAASIPFFPSRFPPFPTNNASDMSVLHCKYSCKCIAATGDKYTVRSLFPFPTTTHSILSKSISAISSRDTSDTRHPVEYKKSTNAKSRMFVQASLNRSISVAEYGFLTVFRYFICDNAAHGFLSISSSAASHLKHDE